MAVIGEMRQLTIGSKTYTIPTYSLPIASSSVLGGIKVGSGLSIDPSTGTLTATGTSITIDTAMSDSSTNAVQNKVIKSYADGLIAALDGGTIGTPGTGKTLTALSETNGQVSATFADISITKSQVSDFPTNVSSFTNDAGYLTSAPVTSVNSKTGAVVVDKLKTGAGQNSTTYDLIGTADTNNDTAAVYIYHPGMFSITKYTSNYARLTLGTSTTPGVLRLYTSRKLDGYIDLQADVAANSTNVISLPNATGTVALTTDIPTVPTNVSAFTNDAGYITGYTETDPTVPAWAKASSKPTYTASEVGALPDSTVIPTKVSELTNDSGYITSYTDEKLKWTASTSSNTYYPLQSTSTATTSTANTLNSVSFYQYYNTAGGYRRFILGNTTAYTSTGGAYGTIRLYGTGATYYGDLNPGTIGANSLTANRTWTLPNATGTIALTADIPTVPTNVSAFTNDAGYLTSYTETDPTVPSWAKASSKPSYTASEVGAAASDHVHGNITNGGDITATAPTIANGDQIVINDASASKITNGPTFDGSTTTKYLSQKGTWESLPQGTTYSAGTGLSLDSTTFNHSNSVTAQTTQAVYPIKIDAQGHISAYGTAVTIVNTRGTATSGGTTLSVVNTGDMYTWNNKQDKATTLSGYGITDAKIANGTITLGSNTITPLTSFTETDPVYSASAAAGITSSNITNWNGKATVQIVRW